MSTEAPQVTSETPPVGTEVWCPNGHGNRFLDVDDKWPFPCPQCQQAMVTEKPPTYTVETQAVDLPTVGRIVHVMVGINTIRPAIVMGIGGTDDDGPDGRLLLRVFLHPGDPHPPGFSEETVIVGYGTRIGGWFWPTPQRKPDQFQAPIE